jgi:hypothetical protein
MKPLSDNKNEPSSLSNNNPTTNNSNSVRLERKTSFSQFYVPRPVTSASDYVITNKQKQQQNKATFKSNYDFVKNRNNIINNEEIADLFEKLKKRIRINRSHSSQDHTTYHKSILKNKNVLSNDSDGDINKQKKNEETTKTIKSQSPTISISGETNSILEKNRHEFKKIYNADKMLLVRPNLISELNARIKSATTKYNINLNNLQNNIAKNINNTHSSFRNYTDFNDSSILLKSLQSHSMPSSTSTAMYQTDETKIIYKLSKKHSKSRNAALL